MKYLFLLAFVFIIGALVSAGIFMLRSRREGQPARSKNMARALAVRVGLSVLVFLLILFSYTMGWIQPTGIHGGR